MEGILDCLAEVANVVDCMEKREDATIVSTEAEITKVRQRLILRAQILPAAANV